MRDYPPLPTVISKKDLCYVLEAVKKRGVNKGKYSLDHLRNRYLNKDYVSKVLEIDAEVYRKQRTFNYVQTQKIFRDFNITPRRYYIAFLTESEKIKLFQSQQS